MNVQASMCLLAKVLAVDPLHLVVSGFGFLDGKGFRHASCIAVKQTLLWICVRQELAVLASPVHMAPQPF